MEKMRIRLLNVAVDEHVSDVLMKPEVNWLPENTHASGLANQESQIHMEPLRSIQTEEDPFHTGAESNAVHGFTPVAQTDEYIKTELILAEELTDIMNEPAANTKEDDQVNHQCGICSRSFNTKAHLNGHLRLHSKDRKRKFACDLCGKTFYEKCKLNSHRKIHTGERYPCTVCGKGFTYKENLKTHMIRKHFDKPKKCTSQSSNNDVGSIKTELISEEEFIDEETGSESLSHAEGTQQPALAADNKQQTGVNTAMDSVTCEVCHNSYPGELIKTHMRLRHNNKDFKCQFCSRSYTTKFYLMVHLRSHSKDRRREFACDLCGKTFYEKDNLQKHKKIHTGDRYSCKVCGDFFMRKGSLKTHVLRRKHFDKSQQFTPQSCNNDVGSIKTELISEEEFIDEENGSESVSHAQGTQQPVLARDNKSQTRVDTAVDSVTCEICHNIYPSKLIKVHVRFTHNDKTYKCEICSRVYWKKSAFEKHLSTHDDNRPLPHACEQCGSKFVSKAELKRHMNSHRPQD